MSTAGLRGVTSSSLFHLCHSCCTCNAHSPLLQTLTIQGPFQSHYFQAFLDLLLILPHTPTEVWGVFLFSLLHETFTDYLSCPGTCTRHLLGAAMDQEIQPLLSQTELPAPSCLLPSVWALTTCDIKKTFSVPSDKSLLCWQQCPREDAHTWELLDKYFLTQTELKSIRKQQRTKQEAVSCFSPMHRYVWSC